MREATLHVGILVVLDIFTCRCCGGARRNTANSPASRFDSPSTQPLTMRTQPVRSRSLREYLLTRAVNRLRRFVGPKCRRSGLTSLQKHWLPGSRMSSISVCYSTSVTSLACFHSAHYQHAEYNGHSNSVERHDPFGYVSATSATMSCAPRSTRLTVTFPFTC